jgi:hypothetical protein
MDMSARVEDLVAIEDRVSAARPIFIYNEAMPERVGSIPLQALIPARHIGAKALYFGPGMDPEVFLDRHPSKLMIFTKVFDDAALTLAQAAARRRIRIVGVFCDLHTAGDIGQRNKVLCELSDAIVAPTARMAAFMEEHFGKECSVIEEPVEYPRCPPRFSPAAPIKMLWFGHANNHDTLPSGLKALAQFRGAPLSLMIVSNDLPNVQSLQALSPNIPIGFMPWSPSIQFDMMRNSDVIFIPRHDIPAKQAKGQARVIASIQAGRVAIAHPLPQYQELGDFCFLSRDYGGALQAALNDRDKAVSRVAAGQRFIDTRFSQEACADKWRRQICALT